MEAMKALILTIIELNLVSKGLSFLLYCHNYGALYDISKFLVPFMCVCVYILPP